MLQGCFVWWVAWSMNIDLQHGITTGSPGSTGSNPLSTRCAPRAVHPHDPSARCWWQWWSWPPRGNLHGWWSMSILHLKCTREGKVFWIHLGYLFVVDVCCILICFHDFPCFCWMLCWMFYLSNKYFVPTNVSLSRSFFHSFHSLFIFLCFFHVFPCLSVCHQGSIEHQHHSTSTSHPRQVQKSQLWVFGVSWLSASIKLICLNQWSS